ncbi:MazG nucleotide pyrophosphohydrolase domain-containing protein [Halorussus aquaticus]|uniref:MazG nucleotide pyrophosphohydrolase domain-containing protein n=1 Tax=Halorussus aquaticus TaxID=2953748 RepID=A0ABD5Q6I6_9EURY|nr:MazG nucleotide pyrophosphohydrolase domain-containing protein [Halorussus aquaticus]
MKAQERVAEFFAEHDLEGEPAYQILDLASEVGELAKDVNDSTDYGASPEALDVKTDELGDALFALLAVAESLDVDADEALDEALAKYRTRIEETGDPGSGE